MENIDSHTTVPKTTIPRNGRKKIAVHMQESLPVVTDLYSSNKDASKSSNKEEQYNMLYLFIIIIIIGIVMFATSRFLMKFTDVEFIVPADQEIS